MNRLALYLIAALTGCVLGLCALVAHTRALTAAHLEVAHLFDAKSVVKVAAPPPAAELCAPDAGGAVGTPHAELWGDVVVPGVGAAGAAGNTASSAAACCASCASTRGCNVWVWCAEPGACQQQCWLKRVGNPVTVAAHASGGGIPWHSGTLPKDADVPLALLPPPDDSIAFIALATPRGAIRLRLRPEWSPSSVAFVRLLAAHALCTPACEFYRVEPGFLLQGSMRALIPANNVTTPGPRPMRRSDVGWAGAGPGPDFFIYLGDQPATHWGVEHTVWAEVADTESLARADEFAALPPSPTPPGQMHMIASRLPIDVRRDDGVAVA
jgi:hypothetical protein